MSETEFVPSESFGWTSIDVLPDLIGHPWNDITQAFLRAVRPSRVRVLQVGDVETTDAIAWRVTVYVRNGTINSITQEVEVDLPPGIAHGFDLACAMEKLPWRAHDRR